MIRRVVLNPHAIPWDDRDAMNIPAMSGVALKSHRVLLRPYGVHDIDDLYEAAIESVETVYPWLSWCCPNYTRTDSEKWINDRSGEWAAGRAFSFLIADPTTGRFVGGCGLNHISQEYRMANLGYWVRRSAMGQGYAPAATRLLARFGLKELDLNRIEIVAALENRASQRAAEKAGAFREGVLRSRLTIHGKVHDAVMYSMIPSDFREYPQ